MTPVDGASTEARASFGRILARLRAELSEEAGASQVSLTPVAYEDRLFSHLLRVRALGRPSGRPSGLFIKIFKTKPDVGVERMRQRVAHDFEATTRIARAMEGSNELGVVRPIACYLDELAIVTEEAPGRTLREYLDATAAWFPSLERRNQLARTLGNIGRWLRRFQAIDPGSGGIAVTGLRDYMDVRLTRLVERGVWSSARRLRVLGHLDELAKLLPRQELPQVMIHADFAPGNILVDAGRITVIDLSMVQPGTALHDISRLYLQLDVLRAKPQFRPKTVDLLQQALLSGYDEQLTPEQPLFRYLTMLHRINHLSTLSFTRERFPASLVSRQVLRLHRSWIDADLQLGAAQPLR